MIRFPVCFGVAGLFLPPRFFPVVPGLIRGRFFHTAPSTLELSFPTNALPCLYYRTCFFSSCLLCLMELAEPLSCNWGLRFVATFVNYVAEVLVAWAGFVDNRLGLSCT